MIVFVQPEAVALSVHLGQAAFVAFVADLEKRYFEFYQRKF